jgi:sporulation protein YlmC with PRC-barrel domain
VTLAEGRNLGRPTDIVIDPERHEASLIVLARGNVPDSTLFVAAEDVRSFDTDTLAIDSVDALRIAATDPAALALLARGLDFGGRPLIDARGRRLGKVVQIRLDENGRVVEYRARRGMLGWLKPRTKIKPAELRTAGGEMGVLRETEAAPPSAGELSAAPEVEAERTPEDEH